MLKPTKLFKQTLKHLGQFSCCLCLVVACATNTVIATDSVDLEELVSLHNQLRQSGPLCSKKVMQPSNGESAELADLNWNENLAIAAKQHANYLAKTKKLSHKGKRGSSAGKRISKAGYEWQSYAENVAYGQHTIESVMQSWRKSPAHCKNIVNENLKEMGAALTEGYWVVVMAQPMTAH